MHMQVKPEQRYFRHEKGKNAQILKRDKMKSTQRCVLTIIIVHPNFWIGTLRDARIQNFVQLGRLEF